MCLVIFIGRVTTAQENFPSGVKGSPTGKQTQENALTKG